SWERVLRAALVRHLHEHDVRALLHRRLAAVGHAAQVAGDDEDADRLARRRLIAREISPAAVVVPVLRDLAARALAELRALAERRDVRRDVAALHVEPAPIFHRG